MGFLALAAALGGVPSDAPSVTVPASISKDGTTTPLTTDSVSGIVSGGQAPFTYAWSQTSGSVDITATAPTALTTSFTGTGLASGGETLTATFMLTVTDALNRTATDSINITIERYGTLSASRSPTSVSGSGNTSTVTSNSSTCTVSGGSGNFSYSWVKVSGDTVTAVSSSNATTAFRGSSMSAGETRTATFRCDVTDNVTGLTTSTGNVTISVNRYSALSGTRSPTSVSGWSTTSTVNSNSSTAAGSGGSGSYSYAWQKVSGDSITAVSASSATTVFRGSSMSSGETRSAVFNCVITDTVTGSTFTTGNVTVTVDRYASLGASVSPSSVSGSGSTSTVDSNAATVTPSGGSGSYSYSWAKVSGGTITAVSASSASSAFRATSLASPETRTASFACTVTDNVTGSQVTTSNVSISISRTVAVTFNPVPGTYNASGGPNADDVITITSSAAVTWSWTGGVGVSCNRAQNYSGTSITFTLVWDPEIGFSRTVTLTASGAGSGTWTLNFVTQNEGGGSVMTL